MRKYLWLLLLLCISCKSYNDGNTYVQIDTDYGKIVVKLYKQTPFHTRNFVKLANEHFYDSVIFHRVIKDFMIQGGDPTTKHAVKGKQYGETDAGYLIESEFVDTLFHKKGVIAMARESDDVNPSKKSSSSQFYIVVGKVYTDQELDLLATKLNRQIRERVRQIVYEDFYNPDNLEKNAQISFEDAIDRKIDSLMFYTPLIEITDAKRKAYTTVGGTPHLDGNYTVFGEVVEGLDVVEIISKVKTDNNDRPINDIKMKIRVLN